MIGVVFLIALATISLMLSYIFSGQASDIFFAIAFFSIIILILTVIVAAGESLLGGIGDKWRGK